MNVGDTYGYLKVTGKVPNTNGKKVICECKCGSSGLIKWKDSIINTVRRGGIPSCGCYKNIPNNLKGKVINNWRIIDELGNNKVRAQCKCGNIRIISKYNITSGHSKSCGCLERPLKKDVVDTTINNWTVLKDNRDSTLTCKCICGNVKVVDKYSVVHGLSKSCGCLRGIHSSNTMYKLYGDISASRILNPREQWQIDVLSSRDNFRAYIISLNDDLTVSRLCALLDTSQRQMLNYIHKYECEDIISFYHNFSVKEDELYEFILENTDSIVIRHDRKVLDNKELDIYIPDLKLAFEFNGNYWHSSIYKDAYYHQNKTLECAKKGIRLIHIFQYEYVNNKDKILTYIKDVLNSCEEIVYARNTVVKEISSDIAKDFCEKYHLQGWSSSKIALGCYKDNELISVMTFSKPRFSNKYDYELIRYCVKDNISIVGGAHKLFSKFITKYNPNTVITYSDITKFTGNIYLKLGFKAIEVTKPSYLWVESQSQNTLSRYQTQKHKLLEKGLGTADMTEDEIMYARNFLKIYDSGNIKLEWRK